MAAVTGLGLSSTGHSAGEIRVGFRHGLVRHLGVTIGGAGVLGLAIAVVDLAQREPQQFFELLSKWGWVWIITLAAIFVVWDFSRALALHLGKLASSVQETAVAMNRIADKDDRDRDRMQTEIAFVGQRVERLTREHQETREEQRDHHREVVGLIGQLAK